jgi:hypothetical protein
MSPLLCFFTLFLPKTDGINWAGLLAWQQTVSMGGRSRLGARLTTEEAWTLESDTIRKKTRSSGTLEIDVVSNENKNVEHA